MARRTQRALIAAAVLALAGVAGVAIAGRVGSRSEPASKAGDGILAPRSPFKGALRPQSPPRDFALRDQDGRLVRLADERGRVVVLSPMYTTCRETCPLVAQQIREALIDLEPEERAQVRAFALTVDPAGDTPTRARRFLTRRRVLRNMDFLLGTRRRLAPIWRDYGFAPRTPEHEHNSHVVLIDKRGRQRVGFQIGVLTPEGLGHDLRLLVHTPAVTLPPDGA
jgi:protein SCO1/2